MKYGLGISIFFVIAASAQIGLAADPDLRPTWHQENLSELPVNTSFLANRNSVDFRPSWETKLFDQGFASRMRQDYEDKTRDFEMRQNYGLMDMGMVMAYNSTMTALRHDLVTNVRQMQLQGYQQNMKTAAQNGEVSRPVMVTGSITSFYMGNPVDVTVAPDTKFWARADIPNQVGELKFANPIVSTDVMMNASANADSVSGAIPAIDPTTGQPYERYKVSVSRALPLWDLSSGLTYGGSTSTMRASLSKPIVGNLTGVVESVSPLTASAAAAGAPNEHTVRVVYGLSF